MPETSDATNYQIARWHRIHELYNQQMNLNDRNYELLECWAGPTYDLPLVESE